MLDDGGIGAGEGRGRHLDGREEGGSTRCGGGQLESRAEGVVGEGCEGVSYIDTTEVWGGE